MPNITEDEITKFLMEYQHESPKQCFRYITHCDSITHLAQTQAHVVINNKESELLFNFIKSFAPNKETPHSIISTGSTLIYIYFGSNLPYFLNVNSLLPSEQTIITALNNVVFTTPREARNLQLSMLNDSLIDSLMEASNVDS